LHVTLASHGLRRASITQPTRSVRCSRLRATSLPSLASARAGKPQHARTHAHLICPQSTLIADAPTCPCHQCLPQHLRRLREVGQGREGRRHRLHRRAGTQAHARALSLSLSRIA
jgi:hypothetical protein